MATKTYYEKLKDPRWQKKRLEIMGRDEFRCQCCGDDESSLSVHHKVYIYGREPWDYPDGYLVTLCDSCHEVEEDARDINSDFTKVLLSDGYLSIQLKELLDLLRRLPAGDHALYYISEAVKRYESFRDIKSIKNGKKVH
jgi:hypothetical protein